MQLAPFALALALSAVAPSAVESAPAAALLPAPHGGSYPNPPPPPPPPPAPTPGGTYGGPGDGVPTTPGPSTPGPSGPSTPGPGPGYGGPADTPAPRGPSTPAGGGPSTPPGGGGGGTGGPSAPSTGSPELELRIDQYDWQLWWLHNRAPYLDLKRRLHEVTATGSDDFFIGHGQTRARVKSMRPERADLEARVLPALIDAIRTERSNDIVTGAMIAAGKIGMPNHRGARNPVDEAIRSRLDDPVQVIRETAILSLGISGHEGSYGVLRAIVLDQDEGRRATGRAETGCDVRSRAFAAYALGLLGSRTTIEPLRQLVVQDLVTILEDSREAQSDLKVAAALAYGLVPMRSAPAHRAEDEASLGPWATRGRQLEFAVAFCFSEGRDDLRPIERAHMARSIGLLLQGAGDDVRSATIARFVKVLTGRTRPDPVEIRQSAALLLGAVGDCDDDEADRDLRRALRRALEDPDPHVQNFALISMGLVGARASGVEADAEGLAQLRKELSRTLATGKRRRAWAGVAIGVMERGVADAGAAPSADQLGSVTRAMDQRRSGNEVAGYAIGLGLARHRDAAPALMKQLRSRSDDAVRAQLCVALGLMDSHAAMEQLDEIVASSRYRAQLLEAAAVALGLIGDARIAPELARMLREDARSLSSQASIASALGFIGDARSIDPLLEMFTDEELTDGARAFAGVALGIVGDRDLLPWHSKYSVDLNYAALCETLAGGGDGLLEIY